MGTFTVQNRILTPSGNPVANVPIFISLRPEGCFRTSDSAELVSPLVLATDATGLWTTGLEDNLNISPAGSYYEIEERVPPMYGGTQIWNIYVLGAGGWVGDLWTTQNPPPAYLPVYEGPQGPEGLPGPPGPQGPKGDEGDPAKTAFVWDQMTPASSWVVLHNLGYFPAGIWITDSGGQDVEGEVTHDSVNQLTLSFSAAFSGKVLIS